MEICILYRCLEDGDSVTVGLDLMVVSKTVLDREKDKQSQLIYVLTSIFRIQSLMNIILWKCDGLPGKFQNKKAN